MQASSASLGVTLRTSAAQATSIAASQLDLDHQLFVGWLASEASGDSTTAQAFVDRMRPAFRSAFDGWLATAPAGTIPAGNPLETDAYDERASDAVQTAVEANRLADLGIARAAQANQTGDNYMLVTVIVAMVLFFAGIVTRFGERRVRRGLVALAALLLAGGTLFMLSLPVSFAIQATRLGTTRPAARHGAPHDDTRRQPDRSPLQRGYPPVGAAPVQLGGLGGNPDPQSGRLVDGCWATHRRGR